MSSWDKAEKGPSAVGGDLVEYHICPSPGLPMGVCQASIIPESRVAKVHKPHLPLLRVDLPRVLVCLLLLGMWCHRVSY